MQIWYLSPFLLAMLVWWVATRRHPEDKEKWTWLALGVCGGAVIMFGLAFVSERKAPSAEVVQVNNGTPITSTAEPKPILQGDSAVEVFPPVRLREGRTVTLGSLQITLLGVAGPTARLQIEPRDELTFFSDRMWTYTNPTSYKPNTNEPDTSVRRVGVEVTLGEYLELGFHGNIYRLSLLELPRAVWEFAPADAADVFASHAVIRLIKRSTQASQGSPSASEATVPKKQKRNGKAVAQQSVPGGAPASRERP